MDRPGVRQVPEGSGEQGRMEETGCEVLCGAPASPVVKGLMSKKVNQPSLPTPFDSVLVSISAFMALSTVFYSINSPDNSLLSHSVPLVLYLPY